MLYILSGALTTDLNKDDEGSEKKKVIWREEKGIRFKERILSRHMQVVFKYLKESLVEKRRKVFLSDAEKNGWELQGGN